LQGDQGHAAILPTTAPRRAGRILAAGAACRRANGNREKTMAKGLDKKKEQKKKPAKTLKEKRAEKNEKKSAK
jgi:hypothetical protein